jgi:hypothetical protein
MVMYSAAIAVLQFLRFLQRPLRHLLLRLLTLRPHRLRHLHRQLSLFNLSSLYSLISTSRYSRISLHSLISISRYSHTSLFSHISLISLACRHSPSDLLFRQSSLFSRHTIFRRLPALSPDQEATASVLQECFLL